MISNRPWLAPADYVFGEGGDMRLCLDYMYKKKNKKTMNDAYPLPLIDDVQDWLSGSAVFSKLDLETGYWRLFVDPKDREKKKLFSPGPGYEVL